jgi:glutathione S-transferase
MATTLYYHPWSRAANVVWMLEEVERAHDLRVVDIMKGAQKAPDVLAINPMGKLPILDDDGTIVTESAAIGLYLADRYAYGRLAPKVDDAARGTYLRWTLFAPSVIEPATMAKDGKWEYKESQAGWGSHAAVLTAMESAIAKGPFILGDTFSMADVVFGGTLRFMLMVKQIDPRPSFVAYTERLAQRPALQRAEARNAAMRKELGLDK